MKKTAEFTWNAEVQLCFEFGRMTCTSFVR